MPEGKGEGVYIQATAYELEDIDEIRAACLLHKGSADKANDFTGDAVRRVYKAIPQKAWMNDAEINNGIFVRDYRVDVSLADG